MSRLRGLYAITPPDLARVEEALASGAVAPRIARTAPTGKAAVRLQSAVLNAKQSVPCTPEVRAAIPETASTIDRYTDCCEAALAAGTASTRASASLKLPQITDDPHSAWRLHRPIPRSAAASAGAGSSLIRPTP